MMRKALPVGLTCLLIFSLFLIIAPDIKAQRKRGVKISRPTLSPDQDAEQQARAFWYAKITRCGEDYFTRDRGYIHQFKNLTISVESRGISGADRLNGIQWVGYTTARPAQSRTFSPQSTLYQDAGWSKWAEGYTMAVGGVELRAEIRKVRGLWTISPDSVSQAGVLQAVTCGEAANPLEAYREWRRKQEEARMTAEVRDFLGKAESYWHLYSADLPADMYKFMAKNPNSLHSFTFLPNGAWAIVGNYDATWNNMPDDIAKAVNEEGRDLSSLTVASNGGWVMLTRDIENFNGSERRGFSFNNIPITLKDKLWEYYNKGSRMDLVRLAPNGAWVIIEGNQPNTGTPCYLGDDGHGFGFTYSDGLSQSFASAIRTLYNDKRVCRINDIAFTPNGGYVIIFNQRGYSADGVPDKLLEGVKYWYDREAFAASTGVSTGFNDEWIVYNSK